MTHPNLANIAAWVDALRSGRYEQGGGQLLAVDDDGVKRFCCLGVACDISGLGHWDDYLYYRVGDARRLCTLPPAVAAWLGVPPPYGVFFGNDDLAYLNDDKGWTFGQIADLLEARYLTPATTTTSGD